MGKISKGILGGFSGTVGNVVGASWKGIDYMRIKAASKADAQTESQLSQRNKFTMVLDFLKPFTMFLRIGFQKYAVKMSEFNSAVSYNIKNAISGTYPGYSVDYANALVSRGDLTSSLNGSASSASQGTVTVDWDDNSTSGSASPTDKAMIAVYNPSKKEVVYTTAGATRDALTEDITVPQDYSGDTVEVYLAFISDDGKEVSNSKHVGSIVVT